MEKVRAAAIVTWPESVEFAAEAFAATGVPPADARKAAEALVDADLHGTVTHGLKNLRNYVSRLLDGRINPRPNMRDVGGAQSGAGHQRRQRARPRRWPRGHGASDRAGARVRRRHGLRARQQPLRRLGLLGAPAAAPQHDRLRVHHRVRADRAVGRQGRPRRQQPAGVGGPVAGGGADGELPPNEAESMFLDIALSVVAGNRLDIYRRRGEPIPAAGRWTRTASRRPIRAPPTTAARTRRWATTRARAWPSCSSAITSFLAGAAFDDQRPGQTGRHQPLVRGLRHRAVRGPGAVRLGSARGARARPAQPAAARVRARVRAGRPGERQRAQLHARRDPVSSSSRWTSWSGSPSTPACRCRLAAARSARSQPERRSAAQRYLVPSVALGLARCAPDLVTTRCTPWWFPGS